MPAALTWIGPMLIDCGYQLGLCVKRPDGSRKALRVNLRKPGEYTEEDVRPMREELLLWAAHAD